jgi:hypothetical protein
VSQLSEQDLLHLVEALGPASPIRAELTSAGASFEQIFMVRITEPEKEKSNKSSVEEPDATLGLPKLALAYKEEGKGDITWETLEAQGISFDHQVVMHPFVEGDVLSAIYINMDSGVLLNNRGRVSTEAAITLAERRYISTVYFHTLFLYMITRHRGYDISRSKKDGDAGELIDLAEYLKDLFQSQYAEFLLNFEMQELVSALE